MNSFLERAKQKAKLGKNVKTDVPKKAKKPKHKSKKVNSEPVVPGTIFISHLPHGFYEEQLKEYFQQFGKVLKLRVARSRKTGGCKGYAYLQFQSEDVAKIAAEAMNNYMFFEKILKCEFIPAEKFHPKTFKGWKTKLPLSSEKNRIRQNTEKSESMLLKSKKKRIARVKKLQAALKSKGIVFKFKVPSVDKSQ